MPAAVKPGDCFVSSNRGDIPGAMPPWRAMRSVCATRKRGPTATATTPPLTGRSQAAAPLLAPHRVTWLVLRRPEQRTPEEHPLLAQLTAQDAKLADSITLARDFPQHVRQRQSQHLDPWLARAAESPLVPL